MVADASPWVVDLSSDSEDDARPLNRLTADNGASKQYLSVISVVEEDDDVQILHVSKSKNGLQDDGIFRQAFESKSLGSLSKGGRNVFQFAATKDPLKQHDAVVSQKQSKKKEARQERRMRAALRLHDNGRNAAEVQLKLGEVPDRKEQKARVRGVPSATTGLGFVDMARLVTGTDIGEWCHSLRMCQGPELSNLHCNILRFCKAQELTPEQRDMRRDALEYVQRAVFEIWPSAEVHLFGSTATDLALPSSDIDVVVISPVQSAMWQKPSTMSWLSALSRNLKRHGQCQKIRQIPFAKVPLLKVQFNSGLACDISFDVPNGIRGVPVIRQFMQHYEALRPLCLVLKFLLGQKSLNQLYTGGVGSFCLINMLVSHLQNLGVTGSGHDIGILLLTFFVHFSTMHNYRTDVVCTRPGYCAPKHARGWLKPNVPELLSCEDPLDPTSDIARGSYRIDEVRKFFLNARTSLLVHWHDEDVLSQLLDTSRRPSESTQKSPDDPAPAPTPRGRKKSKKRKNKMNQQGVSSGGEEDARARKIRRLTAKSVQQVSDSSRRRLSTVQRPAKLQKRKKKQKMERIYLDFWGNHVSKKQRRTGKAARKGRS